MYPIVADEPDKRIPGAGLTGMHEMSESPVRVGIPCIHS